MASRTTLLMGVLLAVASATGVAAQDTLPRPEPPFRGKIGTTYSRYSVEPFDVGMDNVSAVSDDYKPPFAFKGRIEHVTIELK